MVNNKKIFAKQMIGLAINMVTWVTCAFALVILSNKLLGVFPSMNLVGKITWILGVLFILVKCFSINWAWFLNENAQPKRSITNKSK